MMPRWCHYGAIMELEPSINALREQLAVAAEAGGEPAQVAARRLLAALDPAVRLMLLDVLGAAAAEITRELAPGSVELRLRGGDPEFAVTAPRPGRAPERDQEPAPAAPPQSDGDDEGVSRINLRLPDGLKRRVEEAAARQGLSINAWLVRAVAEAVDSGRAGPGRDQRAPQGGQRYTGWGR